MEKSIEQKKGTECYVKKRKRDTEALDANFI